MADLTTLLSKFLTNLGLYSGGVSGVLTVNTSAIGNVGAGEDNLMTYSLPANTLSLDGKTIRITAWGTTAANANAKTIKGYFGSTALFTSLTDNSNGKTWYVTGTVTRTSATAQDACAWEAISSVATPASTLLRTTPAETLSGAVVIKCTGEGVADNDIVQRGLMVELLN